MTSSQYDYFHGLCSCVIQIAFLGSMRLLAAFLSLPGGGSWGLLAVPAGPWQLLPETSWELLAGPGGFRLSWLSWLAAPGGSWRTQAAPGGPKRLLAPPGCSWLLWRLLHGGSWRLLASPGGSWQLLEAPGGSWGPWPPLLALAAPGAGSVC